jgi:hypothetical protein
VAVGGPTVGVAVAEGEEGLLLPQDTISDVKPIRTANAAVAKNNFFMTFSLLS